MRTALAASGISFGKANSLTYWKSLQSSNRTRDLHMACPDLRALEMI